MDLLLNRIPTKVCTLSILLRYCCYYCPCCVILYAAGPGMLWASIHVSIACFPSQGGQRRRDSLYPLCLYSCHPFGPRSRIHKQTHTPFSLPFPSLSFFPPSPAKDAPTPDAIIVCFIFLSVYLHAQRTTPFKVPNFRGPGSEKRVRVRNHRKNYVYLELLIVMFNSFLRARGGTGGG